MNCLHAHADDRRVPLDRHGFTLIELLVASVLAALLIGGIVMAAGALARDARESGSVDAASQFDAAANLVRLDLINAQTAEFRPDGSVVLVGQGGLDSSTGRPTGRPVRIEYKLIEAGRRRASGDGRGAVESTALLLVREQVPLDVPGEHKMWRELVFAGVTGMQLSPVSDDASRTSSSHAESPACRNQVPGRLRVRIETTRGATDRIIEIR